MLMNPEDDLLSIPFRHVVYFGCGLPLAAFASCVFLALNLHFDQSTRTHCNVPNWLPSISAAIGSYEPEMFLWRTLIALHCLPRFALAFVYRNFYLSSPYRPFSPADTALFRFAAALLTALHVAENAALLTLSLVGSVDNKLLHECSFIIFIVASSLYMLLTLYLFHASGRRRASTSGEKSFQYKLLLFFVFMGAILSSTFFYWKHNTYCEEGVYTLFALSEYVVVIANIAFHGTALHDFSDKRLVLLAGQSNDFRPIKSQEISDEWKST